MNNLGNAEAQHHHDSYLSSYHVSDNSIFYNFYKIYSILMILHNGTPVELPCMCNVRNVS